MWGLSGGKDGGGCGVVDAVVGFGIHYATSAGVPLATLLDLYRLVEHSAISALNHRSNIS